MSRRLRRLEALRRSTATAAAMAELRQRHTHGAATRMAAYLRQDCGRCKVETAEKGEAELQARPIGEWGSGERMRAQQSGCDGDGERGEKRRARRRVRVKGRLGGDLSASLGSCWPSMPNEQDLRRRTAARCGTRPPSPPHGGQRLLPVGHDGRADSVQ